MTRILVFGAGSIGGVYTYILSKAGASTTAVCRSNHAVVAAHGFTITSEIFGAVAVRPAAVTSTAAEATGTWDFIVVCSKAMPGAEPSTASVIQAAVGPRTTIVLIQNGIGIEDEYAALFPDNPLLSCVVYLPATQTSAGIIIHKEQEILHIGTFPADAPRPHKEAAERFAGLIRAGGATAQLHDDIQPERWSKLVVNASWNPICALSRSRDAQFLESSPGALAFVQDVMLEVVAIAQAAGIKGIGAETVELQLGRARARVVPGVEPSMMADVMGGRVMEVEAIVGNTIRAARKYGVKAPLLDTLYALVKALDVAGARTRAESAR